MKKLYTAKHTGQASAAEAEVLAAFRWLIEYPKFLARQEELLPVRRANRTRWVLERRRQSSS